MPTSVALGSHFEEFVKQQLESGRFNNVSEVVRAGLRLLEDAEKLRQLKVAIQAGIDSEDVGSVEAVVARNRARRAKSKASKK